LDQHLRLFRFEQPGQQIRAGDAALSRFFVGKGWRAGRL